MCLMSECRSTIEPMTVLPRMSRYQEQITSTFSDGWHMGHKRDANHSFRYLARIPWLSFKFRNWNLMIAFSVGKVENFSYEDQKYPCFLTSSVEIRLLNVTSLIISIFYVKYNHLKLKIKDFKWLMTCLLLLIGVASLCFCDSGNPQLTHHCL